MNYTVKRLKADIAAIVKLESDTLGILPAKNLAKRRVLTEQLERIRNADKFYELRSELHAYLFVRDEEALEK